MWFVRGVCGLYWLALTISLLVPDPLALLGILRPPGPPGGRIVHFVFFTVLGFLVGASRFPVSQRRLVGMVVAYAVLIEGAQVFVPPRSVEVLDVLENLLGLAAGGCLWWAASGRSGPRR